jgi:hypothetical protein
MIKETDKKYFHSEITPGEKEKCAVKQSEGKPTSE